MTRLYSTCAPGILCNISIAFSINNDVIIPSIIGEIDNEKHVTTIINKAITNPHL